MSGQIVADGIWTINPLHDPQLISPLLSRHPSTVNYLKFGMKNRGTNDEGQVFYSAPGLGYSESRSAHFTNDDNGAFNWIVVRLDDLDGWGGASNIDRIRIDPVQTGSGGSDDVLTDYIFLRKDIHNPEQPEIVSVVPSTWTNGSITVSFESNDPADEKDPEGPDIYGSGVADFRYRVDPNPDQTMEPDRFDDRTGLAEAEVTYAAGDLPSGVNSFHVYCFDKVGRVSVDNQANLYFDGIDPTNPTTVSSSSHTVGSWSSDNTIAVSWSGASDGHSGISGYSWSWTTSPTSIPNTTRDGTGTSTTSPPLEDGDSWYFHVRTLDNAGNWNNGAKHHGPFKIDTTAPVNPTSVSSSSHTVGVWSSDNTVMVSWSGASDAHSGVSGYSWEWTTSSGTVPDATQDGTGTSTTSPALADGGSWYFHVRTRDNVGNWNSGATHYGPFKIDVTVPINPTTVSSSSHEVSDPTCDNTIDMEWSGASDATSGVSGYSWDWTTSPSTVPDATQDGTETGATSAALAEGEWYFHIRTRDNAGNWNSEAVHTGPYLVTTTGPGPAIDVSSSSHEVDGWSNIDDIELTWNSPKDDCGGLSGYSYLWSSQPSDEPDATVETTSNSVVLTDVEDGCGYFHLRAVDLAGHPGQTVHVGPYCVDTVEPSDPDSVYSVSHQPGVWSPDNTIDVFWRGAADDRSGVVGYGYVWDNFPETIPEPIDQGADSSATSEPLPDGESHYFHIRTRDAAGNWSPSAVHLGPFWIDTAAPGQITDLDSPSHEVGVWSNDNTVDVTWTAAPDPATVIGGYSLSWTQSASEEPDGTIDTEETSTTSPELSDGQWWIHIRAVDGAGTAGPTVHLGPFPIDVTPPFALITRPNGGEIWEVGSLQSLNYTYLDLGSGPATLELTLSIDGGATYPYQIATPTVGTFSYLWTVPDLPSTHCRVRFAVSDAAGNVAADASDEDFVIGSVTDVDDRVVSEFEIDAVFPNPFASNASFRLGIPRATDMTLTIYDIQGRAVRTLSSGPVEPGWTLIDWDGLDSQGAVVPNGLYFYQVRCAEWHAAGTLIRAS